MSNRATTGTLNVGQLRAGSAIIGGMSLPITPGKVYYVKAGNGSDSNSGRSWAKAFATVAKAMTVVADYDVVMVRGAVSGANRGRIVESVTPGTANTARHVTLIGCGPEDRAVGWKAGAATTPCLTLNYKGWTIRNFYFEAPTGAGAIKANRTASVDASDFVIEDCEFYTGAAGIDLVGAPHAWKVKRCKFRSITGAISGYAWVDTGAIICNSTAQAVPLSGEISDCRFTDNKHHIVVPMTDGLIRHNYIQAQGNSITAAKNVDLRRVGGTTDNAARNQVYQNLFGGTYSNAGFYWAAGTGDEWFDNDISSGKTSSRPA